MSLYIVSTPIGNLQDITIRASKVLVYAETIICESTSKASILLNFIENEFNIERSEDQNIISLTEDEEEFKIPSLIQLLTEKDAVLISEAGTPLVSDPGFRLVREAIKRNINVISVPGATALVTALTSSGFPPDKFLFIGYLPKKENKRNGTLELIKEMKIKLGLTIIFYESPHRLTESLKAVNSILGDTEICVCRELTKIHEEIRREKVSESLSHFDKIAPKGEFTVLL